MQNDIQKLRKSRTEVHQKWACDGKL